MELEKGVSKLLDAPPPIDLDALNRQLHRNEAAITEQTTILQTLSTGAQRQECMHMLKEKKKEGGGGGKKEEKGKQKRRQSVRAGLR